jgi:hypothetical protein
MSAAFDLGSEELAAQAAGETAASPHLGCTVCASGVTSPHGATGTAGQVPLPRGIALAALECIRQAYETGTMAHDTAHKAIDDAAAARAANDAVDVNDLPVTPAAHALYGLCSDWDRQALRIPWMLGEKDPRAVALQDCAIALRAAVNGLRRDGDL